MNYSAEVVAKKTLTSKIIELDFKLISPEEISFLAGQFVALILPSGEKKFYSICTPPEQKNLISFCVDVSPGGSGSKYIESLSVGEKVEFSGPHGVFIVKDETVDHLFVATGAGIAPFKSMVPDALEKGFEKKIVLLFGVRNEQDLFYLDYFQELESKYPNFKFIPSLSQGSEDWEGEKGRVTSFLQNACEEFKDHFVYICGGVEMVKDVRGLLIEKGKEMKKIKLEIFV
jgi:NAD(P)H-flavin reductase